MNVDPEQPRGQLTTRTLAMPADSNPSGDIFGGWMLSQMDIAAGICAGQRAQGRVATIAIDAMKFIRPVKVGPRPGTWCRRRGGGVARKEPVGRLESNAAGGFFAAVHSR